MTYKIKQLAELAGVSIRTLHYYDEIGLLNPSGTQKNGYRFYGQAELYRLQQILFYRELGLALEKIKTILDEPSFNNVEALKKHQLSIAQKRRRLDGLIATIDKTIKHMTDKKNLKDEELYDPFRDNDAKKYQTEVRLRWGKTDAYRQSMERVKKLTKSEMEKMKKDAKIFTQTIADAMTKGPADAAVQALIAKHHESIRFFYDCPLDMYRNLGKMYVIDPRFSAYYDKFRPGLAKFMQEAITVYCDTAEKQ